MGTSRRDADRPPPFRVVNARSRAPLVLTCEHASRALPPKHRAPAPRERAVLRTHWGWDIGAWLLAVAVARRLRATAVGARFSRLLVDLNRPVQDETLVRREAEGVHLSWNTRLGGAGIERRMLRYHVPYHEAVDRAILGRLARGVRPLLLSMHTFTPCLDGRRRDFDMGVLFDRSEECARRLGAGLEARGYRVRYNEPYSGRAGMMYSIHRHAIHHGLSCLELEVSQAFFPPGRGASARRTAARLAAAIAGALGPVMAMAAAVDLTSPRSS